MVHEGSPVCLIIICLVNKQQTEGRGLLTPSLGWSLLASAAVIHTRFIERAVIALGENMRTGNQTRYD